jgi:hypothetical protein
VATWSELKSFIRENLPVQEEKDALISVVVPAGKDRTQLVLIGLGGNDSVGDWANIISPVGPLSAKNLEYVCREASKRVCGGIIVMGDRICVQDSFPLANLDINEFMAPLILVAGAADTFESKLTGDDRY